MVTSTCLQFSSLKCLVGISLCFTLHSAVSHVNDRGQVGPGPQRLPTHNTSALLNDSFPLHDAAQKLDTFLDTFRPEQSVLRTPLLPNGIEHGHFNVEHDGNALRSDLSSGVKDVIFDGRNDGKASAVSGIILSKKKVVEEDRTKVSNLLKLPSRSEQQDDELLSLIQLGQRSEDESQTIFYDFALVQMLKHKTSAEFVHEKWVKDKLTIDDIQSFLQKISARDFFGGQDAIDRMQKFMTDHFEWQHLAFLMEMDGIDGLNHFYQTIEGGLLHSGWLNYAAFALDRKSITKTDVSEFLRLKRSYAKKDQLNLFHRFLVNRDSNGVKLEAPLTPNDQTQEVASSEARPENISSIQVFDRYIFERYDGQGARAYSLRFSGRFIDFSCLSPPLDEWRSSKSIRLRHLQLEVVKLYDLLYVPDNNFFTMMPMQDKVMQVGMQELIELFLLRHVRRYS
ncbi:uncharacterized protein PHALS_02223 [Plasmopara halstedii]|uniref:RxLR-like protein n=1 Tax=Plasmopara halstedii TaxID=4781 RepID=A0A0P1AYF4_PLAHL|nr:uncharacterized protein PHALS_02223 [Plasmopara halstedii]CEG45892.1 hypothetical protein PHALS_02223 [Plasmopara halstedii]|eukprot:XP_024582261.1 hypothetical protein PHALS_02223 [Plasmopara halstedii]